LKMASLRNVKDTGLIIRILTDACHVYRTSVLHPP
jgi:hypothetical protein